MAGPLGLWRMRFSRSVGARAGSSPLSSCWWQSPGSKKATAQREAGALLETRVPGGPGGGLWPCWNTGALTVRRQSVSLRGSQIKKQPSRWEGERRGFCRKAAAGRSRVWHVLFITPRLWGYGDIYDGPKIAGVRAHTCIKLEWMTSNLPCVQDMSPHGTRGKWYNHFHKYLLPPNPTPPPTFSLRLRLRRPAVAHSNRKTSTLALLADACFINKVVRLPFVLGKKKVGLDDGVEETRMAGNRNGERARGKDKGKRIGGWSGKTENTFFWFFGTATKKATTELVRFLIKSTRL